MAIKPQRIALMGLMGAGKTTQGAWLAKRLGYHFIDLDVLIAQQENTTVNQLFAVGEAHFRALESKALRSLAQREGIVLALGGGTPCFNDNLAFIKAHFFSIYLKEEIEVLAQRLQNQTQQRPLLQHLHEPSALKEKLQVLLKAREPFYAKADCVVENGFWNKKNPYLAAILADT